MQRMCRAAALVCATGLVGLWLALVPGVAAADTTTFNCDASALRATLLSLPTIEPITANRGQATCQNANGTLVQLPGGLPAPLRAAVAAAQTQVSADGQNALSVGGLTALGVGVGALQPVLAQITAQIQQAVNNVQPITIPTGSLATVLGTSSITIDPRPAVAALAASINLPNLDLLDLQVATAYAGAQCVNGQPQLQGSSQVAGLTVIGQAIPTDQAVSQALTLLNTQSIDLSQLDLSKVVLPPGLSFTDPTIGQLLQNLVKPELANLPPIQIPATVLNLRTTPSEQILQNGQLTQRALHVQLSLAGQSVADVVLGEARVSNASVTCVSNAVAASQLALQCTKRKLTLIDVLDRGNHVALLGAADKSLIGRHVAIYFAGRRRVATAVVRPDGFFTTHAPVPSAGVRYTNNARYQARIGSEHSLNLKLHRRMVVDSIGLHNGQVVIRGRVIRPLASPIAAVRIERRVSCTSTVTVKTIKPRRDGSFTVALAPPPNAQAAVYRAATQVRKFTSNPKRFPTFTLPRVVQLG